MVLERLLARQGRLETELERLGGHDVEHVIEATIHALGLANADAPCGSLSGGERRRVALARLLVSTPDLLLLDEPTNHLDALVTDWLEDWFLETQTPLLLVTHDRYFLDRVVDRIVELDRGELHGYTGGYSDYLEARAARLESERKQESTRALLLRRETAWMRRGPPARTTKAKARIHRYEELVEAAPVALPEELELELPPGPRLGSRVVTLRGVSKRFGDRLVVRDLDFEVTRHAPRDRRPERRRQGHPARLVQGRARARLGLDRDRRDRALRAHRSAPHRARAAEQRDRRGRRKNQVVR